MLLEGAPSNSGSGATPEGHPPLVNLTVDCIPTIRGASRLVSTMSAEFHSTIGFTFSKACERLR